MRFRGARLDAVVRQAWAVGAMGQGEECGA